MKILKYAPILILGLAIACNTTPKPNVPTTPTVVVNTVVTADEANRKVTDGVKAYASANGLSAMWDVVKPEMVGNIKNYSPDKRFVLYLSVAKEPQGYFVPGTELYLVDLTNKTVTQVGLNQTQLMDGAVSPDGKQVAAIEMGGQVMYLWDSTNKSLTRVVRKTGNQYLTLPTWNDNSEDLGFLIDRMLDPESSEASAPKAQLASLQLDNLRLNAVSQNAKVTVQQSISGTIAKLVWVNNALTVVKDSRLQVQDACSPGIKVGTVVGLKMPYAAGVANIPNAYCGHLSYDVASLDIGTGKAARGEKVLAIAPGTVVSVIGSNTVCGGVGTPPNLVAVSHLGTNNVMYSSHYAHLVVTIGTGAVSQGTQLGTVNCIGYTEGSGPGDPPGRWSHIHLTLRSGSNLYSGGTSAAPEPMDGYSDFSAGGNYTSTNGTGPIPPNCNYSWNPGGAWTRQILDNDQDLSEGQGFEKLGLNYWWLDGGNGSGGDTVYTYSDNLPDQSYGKWSTYVPRGQYDVYAYIPIASGNTDNQGIGNSYADNVNYKVQSFSGTVYYTAVINQSANRGCWVKLGGDFVWAQGDRVAVQLGDNVGGARLRRIYYDDIVYYRTARPIWLLSPSGLTLPAGTVGGATSSATYTATNTGGLSGNGALSASNGFTVSQPGVGLNAGLAFNMTVTAPACTVVGTQTATITMSGDDASTTMNVSRVCTAGPAANWAVTPSTMTFNGVVGGAIPVKQGYTLSNTGVTGSYTTFSSDDSWLGLLDVPTLNVTGGSSTTGNTNIKTACTAVGTRTGSIEFRGANTATIVVTYNCMAGLPIWTPAPTTLTLPAGVIGGTDSSSTFTLSNTGTASGTYTLGATNGFTVSPSTGTVANGSSASITVTAPVCTTVGTFTSTISITGSANTVAVSRICAEAPPIAPTGLTLNVSSNGRIFASWIKSANATQYEFAGTFALTATPTALTFSTPIAATGTGSSGAVMVWDSTPEDPAKQNKQLCIQIRAKNAGGSSSLTTAVCTAYKYYSAVSVQSNQPTVKISLP